MISSPCKDCPRKNLPKDKCVKECKLLKVIQKIDSSYGKFNEGCGIDYTEEYGYSIPLSLTSSSYWRFFKFRCRQKLQDIIISEYSPSKKEEAKMNWDKRSSDSQTALNVRILPVLCRQFYNKGLMPIEIIRLTRDILNIIGFWGFYNVSILNQKLECLGCEKNIMDNYIFELLLYYLECEGTYKVEAYVKKNNNTVGYSH